MKSNLILIVFFSFILISCKTERSKTLNFGVFSISVPNNWEKVNIKGIDSYVGGIVMNKKDTLFFDYGNSTALINDAIVIEDIKNFTKMKEEGFSIENLTFSKTPDLDQNQGIFHKEYYMYDTISGFIPKIKVPKRIGNGVTAICFDSLNTKKERLYIYAKNLDTIKQFELLKAFKTIKIIPNSRRK
ncbi:hypothetical protein [Flavobacterium tructae]|uniref:hypothetical protein n=1 Tax=Flavobacterium tructae TaxID=1114873 RepID=UPI0035A8746E